MTTLHRLLFTAALACSLFAAGAAPTDDDDAWALAPHEKFENGEKMLQAVKQELLSNYVTEVSEESLYRAAVQGMMASVDPARKNVNALLTPSSLPS